MSLNNLFYELNRKMAFCKLPLNRSLSLNQDYTVHTTLQQKKNLQTRLKNRLGIRLSEKLMNEANEKAKFMHPQENQ